MSVRPSGGQGEDRRTRTPAAVEDRCGPESKGKIGSGCHNHIAALNCVSCILITGNSVIDVSAIDRIEYCYGALNVGIIFLLMVPNIYTRLSVVSDYFIHQAYGSERVSVLLQGAATPASRVS